MRAILQDADCVRNQKRERQFFRLPRYDEIDGLLSFHRRKNIIGVSQAQIEISVGHAVARNRH